jgi:cytidylate kinase
MQSLALFPCSYTDEAGLIGELSNALQLRVYTDEMLFSDISDQFGIHVEKVKKILFRTSPELNRYKLKKEKYINLLRCSLEARRKLSPGGCIFYGVHTSILDTEGDQVFKVLVVDDEQGRVRRAMQQDGLSEDAAREYIRRHDEKVSKWTQFLFNEEAYAHSLHDLVISWKNNCFLNILGQITERFQRVRISFHPGQRSYAPPLSPMHLYAK